MNQNDTEDAVLYGDEAGVSIIRWSIGGFSYFIWANQDVRVSWHDGQLRLDLSAPAGHRLVWIFVPEAA